MVRALVLGLLAVGVLQPPDEEKPAEDAVKAEWKKLEGDWTVVSAETSGLKATDEFLKATRIRISTRDRSLTAFYQYAQGGNKRSIRIDSSKKPKEMDLVTPDRIVPAIYELSAKGDELKICGDDQAKERPKEFTAPSGSGRSLLVLKKVGGAPAAPTKPAAPATPGK